MQRAAASENVSYFASYGVNWLLINLNARALTWAPRICRMPALQSMQPSTQATALPALLLVLALLPSTALAILTDAELLLDFWDTFPNAPAVLPDWNQSAEGAPCVWAGVSCSPEGRVTHM